MALHTLGTNANTSLQCLPAWSAVLSPADIAAIAASIVSDSAFATLLAGLGAGATAVLTTGTTHTNTTLDTIVATGGAALAQIRPGDLVLKADVPAGTFVAAVAGGGTTITLSQAASGGNNQRCAFVRPAPKGITESGQLVVPNRGILKILPGDVAAIDNTGFPILVSGAAIGYAGSQWHFV